jgi:hypothetical protein
MWKATLSLQKHDTKMQPEQPGGLAQADRCGHPHPTQKAAATSIAEQPGSVEALKAGMSQLHAQQSEAAKHLQQELASCQQAVQALVSDTSLPSSSMMLSPACSCSLTPLLDADSVPQDCP